MEYLKILQKTLLAPPSHPEMLGRICRGGMSVVFKAWDTELNRPVAVKLLAPYLTENGSAQKRFDSAEQIAEIFEDCLVHAQHSTTTPRPTLENYCEREDVLWIKCNKLEKGKYHVGIYSHSRSYRCNGCFGGRFVFGDLESV